MAAPFRLLQGDSLAILPTLADNSIDAIVTDPPYGLSFMGKRWDYDVPSEEIWRECLRVLKPGGHLLAFAGTRTQHRMAVRIEDAGFEIRDMIAWVYGSGFPKSLDVSKAIDKAAGAKREVVGEHPCPAGNKAGGNSLNMSAAGMPATAQITAPATEAARQWQGWGTALKPALEPITVARKPLQGTVAANVLTHGTAALNIDGCRVGSEIVGWGGGAAGGNTWNEDNCGLAKGGGARPVAGRWPANLIHDGSDEVVGCFPDARSSCGGGNRVNGKSCFALGDDCGRSQQYYDTGSAARFFYCAKASKRDRDEGLEGFEEKPAPASSGNRLERMGSRSGPRANVHPTVKPTDLMRYLCRLVTPPGGIVLDPFMGSGSTGKAAMLESFQFIGLERDPEYLAIAEARIRAAIIPQVAFEFS